MRRTLSSLAGAALLLGGVLHWHAIAAAPALQDCACEETYSAEINVQPAREFGGRGYQVVAALRDPLTGNRIVSLDATLRRGQTGRSARELPGGDGTFSLAIEVGGDGESAIYTLELTRSGRKVLFHRAQIRLGD